MRHHYLLWASGEDQSGIVSSVTKALFDHGMNLEDSSMMRLGSEFGIFLIFTSNLAIPIDRLQNDLLPVGRRCHLELGVKKISAKQAAARKRERQRYLVSVHGPDRPGIVYRVTHALASHGFNITDLATHRTTTGPNPGYILFIEGEAKNSRGLRAIQRDLGRIQKSLKTKVGIRVVAQIQL